MISGPLSSSPLRSRVAAGDRNSLPVLPLGMGDGMPGRGMMP